MRRKRGQNLLVLRGAGTALGGGSVVVVAAVVDVLALGVSQEKTKKIVAESLFIFVQR